jgi:hypothetical protein
MYSTFLSLHSLIRWFVLISLLLAISKAYYGWIAKKEFTKLDNSIRHWTATISHIQLVIGICLYSISPVIEYFLSNYKEAVKHGEIRFFGMEHNIMMLTAIVIITIGSAKTKRKSSSNEKFRTMAIWFTIALLIILVSIPWPFSPLASREYFRPF